MVKEEMVEKEIDEVRTIVSKMSNTEVDMLIERILVLGSRMMASSQIAEAVGCRDSFQLIVLYLLLVDRKAKND